MYAWILSKHVDLACKNDRESYLRCFDVVMEVITENLDVGNVLIASLWGQVAREQDYERLVTANGWVMHIKPNTYRK